MIRHLAAISFSPHTSPALRKEKQEELRSALCAVDPDQPIVTQEFGRSGVIGMTGTEDVPTLGTAFVGAAPVDTAHGKYVSPVGAASAIDKDGWSSLIDWLPPFAVLRGGRERDAIEIATDSLGLRRISWAQTGEFTCASTSSCVAASLVGAEVALDQMAVLAMLGHSWPGETPYKGVRKLTAGTRLELKAGLGCTQRYMSPRESSVPSLEEQLAKGPEVIKAVVTACLACKPDMAIELSGGLDSRILLASIAPERRRGRAGLTLDDSTGSDWSTASRIADMEGLSLRRVPITASESDGGALEQDLLRACRELDHAGNPVPSLVLTASLGGRGPDRLSGQNGELLRGFYYLLQPDLERAREQDITRLKNLRLLRHHPIDVSLFDQEFIESGSTRIDGHLSEFARSRNKGWLSALDEFYLAVRIQEWVGSLYSAESLGRQVFAPFMANAWIEWCQSITPRAKHGSRAACILLQSLDAKLAGIRLDSGINPAVIAGGGWRARLQLAANNVQKVQRRVVGRLTGRSIAPVGARSVCQALGHRRIGDVFPLASQSGVLVKHISSRSVSDLGVNWPTLGFLFTLESVLNGHGHGSSDRSADSLPTWR